MIIEETEPDLTVCCRLILLFDEYVSLARYDVKLWMETVWNPKGTLTFGQKQMTRSDHRTF